jgi:Ca2+-binding EF-hand superfamily protein
MLSDFQKKKQGKVFQVFDLNKNGFLERGDYERAVENLTRACGIKAGSPEYSHVHGKFIALWEQVQRYARASSDRVSLDEWLEARSALINDRSQFEALMQSTADTFFQLLDFNRDDIISYEEFTLFYKIYQMDLSEAEENFKRLDTDGDGKVSRADARKLVEEFYYAQDPAAPGNWLYGKL